ncbi:MAG: hypothetical protein KTR30_30205 [Saprospiraceae bacterium]|nr:hypothetical protein [Saprospiraceae bacterium]
MSTKSALRVLTILSISLLSFIPGKSQSITEYGYPEHFIAGALFGGATSYLVYQKTNNKWKAWAIGFGASVLAGGIKEAVDPELLGGSRNVKDFLYTGLGGMVGASIVFPLNRKKKKEEGVNTAFR